MCSFSIGYAVSLLTVGIVVSAQLETALHNYETLHMSTMKHRIHKRDVHTGKPATRQIEFKSMGRTFDLFLQRQRGLLSSDFRVVAVDSHNNERKVDIDSDILYAGYVVGETGTSAVHAVFEDEDTLTATIKTRDDTFIIEPSWRHLPASDNYTLIIYKGSDVKMADDLGEKYCDYVDMNKEMSEDEKVKLEQSMKNEQKEDPSRQKRQAEPAPQALPLTAPPSKNTCQLLLVADYRFFENMGEKNLQKTSSYLISVLDKVNLIYRRTSFGQGYDGFGFEIKEIKIHEGPTLSLSTDHYNEKREKWSTKEFLEVFSRNSYIANFCLAHLFTYQAFEGGVLGLAYIGSPRTYSVGGICSPEYYKDNFRLYLNTGWSSALNRYNRRLLTQEAILVTTHELGHNWGSEHDPDTSECSPSSFKGGKYIMYTYSVSGYDSNNDDFSPCTKRSVGAVLRSKSSKCFSEERKAYCGNSRVEEGEECDVGLKGLDDDDPCCSPDCKLRPWVTCSDLNDGCCKNCQPAPGGRTIKCHESFDAEASCLGDAYCDGKNKDCPKPEVKDDGTTCLDKGECHNGTCLPFCEIHGFESCICDDVENSCFYCCRSKINNNTCSPFSPTGSSYLELPNGMPCVMGYCNNGKCVKQVQDLVERFWSIIENLTPDQFVQIMRANIVGTVIILSLIVWIPVSCVVSFKDRQRRKDEKETLEWHRYDNPYLVRPEDRGRIKKKKVPTATLR